MIYTFHPQIIGRPGRLPLLETLVARAVEDGTVRVTTTADIAERARYEIHW